jgi:copper(I)-binding protein
MDVGDNDNDERSLQSAANLASCVRQSSQGDRNYRKMEGKLKRITYLFGSMLLIGALNSQPAQSQEAKAGDLLISQPWSRAAPRGAETASSYLTIENKGATADRLVGGSTDVAEKVQIEKISMVGGGMQVSPVEGGLGIAPGEKLVLAPGGNRIGLLKLRSQMKKGTKVPMTLVFEKAGQVVVSFDVLGPAAKGPAAPKGAPNTAADDSKMKK